MQYGRMPAVRIAAAGLVCASLAACGGAEWPPPQWGSAEGYNYQHQAQAQPAEKTQQRTAQLTPPPGGEVIRVKPGDTLYHISTEHGTSIATLIRLNGLTDPNTIYAGDRLVIPASNGSREVASIDGDAVSQPAPSPPISANVVTSEALPPPSTPARSSRATAAPAPTTQAPAVRTSASRTPVSASPSQPPRSRTVIASTAPTAPAPQPSQHQGANGRTGTVEINTVPPRRPMRAAKLPSPPPRSGRRFAWPVNGPVISNYGIKGHGYRNDGINIEAPRGTPIRAAENGVVVYAGNEVAGFGNLVLMRHAGGFVTAYAHADRLLVRRGQVVKRGQEIATVGSTGSVTSPQLHFEIREGVRPEDPSRLLASRG